MQSAYAIGIAGPSSAGKTMLARRLAAMIPASIVPLDAYYRDLSHLSHEQRARHNFDRPAALDGELIAHHLRELLAGKPIERPVYDFSTHSRTGAVERVEPSQFIIIEGLFTLYWEPLRRQLGTSVYVELDDTSCLDRRKQRDVRERGRTVESVETQWCETARPMAELFVVPTRDYADLVVSGCDHLERSAERILAHVQSKRTVPLVNADKR
jgi:uridine kinase